MPKKEDKHICCLCGEEKSQSKFYRTNSSFYVDDTLPICKECFSKKYIELCGVYKSTKMAMQRMCMAFDVYFEEDLFDNCDRNDDNTIGNYFRMLNMSQNKGKTYENTINEIGSGLSGERKPVYDGKNSGNSDDKEVKIPKRYIDKWGIGFDLADYETLDSHYKYLKDANPNCDSNQEIFILDLCYIKMQQMKSLREREIDNYNKLTESYRKSFTQAGLKTVRDNAEVEDFTIGIGIDTIEKYTPAEYYKDKKMYEDFDNLGDYFKRAVLRPLRNAFLGTNDRDDEYHIESDGEEDE